MATGHEAEQALTAGTYIVHHLGHWNTTGSAQTAVADFTVINIDTLIFSILMGALGLFVMWRAASKATSGVPGRLQAAVEIVLEMASNQAKGIVHSAESRQFVAPLALTVFIWIFLMNSMDFLPVDLLPLIWQKVSGNEHAFLRVVPTADLNATLGMSISVLLICLYYNIKIKGAAGWVHELFTAPFGSHPVLYPINFLMQIIEFLAKTISHGMRLFGNMYAGELIFMLIALMGAAWSTSSPVMGSVLWVTHIFSGLAWAIFHILIVTLQAFIFMMLTLVYVGQAHESH